MEELLMYFAFPLFTTILLESVLAFLLGVRGRKNLGLVVLVNVLTNPVVVLFSLVLEYFFGWIAARLLVYAIAEPLVVVVEWIYYKKYLNGYPHPFVLSLLLNLCSIIGGLLWYWII